MSGAQQQAARMVERFAAAAASSTSVSGPAPVYITGAHRQAACEVEHFTSAATVKADADASAAAAQAANDALIYPGYTTASEVRSEESLLKSMKRW